MVSNAKEDLPDPESPVMTISLFLGNSMSTPFKLCARAPLTTIDGPHLNVTLLLLIQITYLLICCFFKV